MTSRRAAILTRTAPPGVTIERGSAVGMRVTWATTMACATAALALNACGSDDKDGNASTPATAPAVSTATIPAAGSTATTPADGATAPGAELAVGATAHVTRKPLNAAVGDERTFPMDVTVLKIEKGSIGDFKSMNLDANEKQSTPYYVKVRLAATAEGTLPADDDPDLGVRAVDDRGQEQPSITFIGDFERCDDTKPPKPFKRGKSYETCLAFLVGGDGSIEQAQWKGAPGYVLKPVVWK